jgi:transcriptional regulator GlxA family with amidase domain
MDTFIRLILDSNGPFVPFCPLFTPLELGTNMNEVSSKPLDAVIVAVPETAGSALYGMLDVLASAGNIWQTLSRSGTGQKPIQPRIVSPLTEPFRCGNSIPVHPDDSIGNIDHADIVILPELWLDPDEEFRGRYPELMSWISRLYDLGSYVYSACSGAIMLAETGLLDGCEATSHWGYQDLFREQYPQVTFRPGPNLVFADSIGRIVTAGGTTSWHDLAIHIIAKHCSPGEAVRISKVYLLKWHQEGQLPYANLVKPMPHGDSVVQDCESWLAENFTAATCLKQVVESTGIAERTLKRRFKAATGVSFIGFPSKISVTASAMRNLDFSDVYSNAVWD